MGTLLETQMGTFFKNHEFLRNCDIKIKTHEGQVCGGFSKLQTKAENSQYLVWDALYKLNIH